MPEPIKTVPNPAGQGRPMISEEQFAFWLEDMRPFLQMACSLNRAMEKSGIISHEFSIREKYNSHDWFSRKVDAYRAMVGENINEALVTLTNTILDKVKKHESITKDDFDVLKHMSEKHRTAQPFFVTRTETAESKPEDIGKVLDAIEGKTDYADLGREAAKQVVAPDAPVQNQNEAGGNSNVPAQ